MKNEHRTLGSQIQKNKSALWAVLGLLFTVLAAFLDDVRLLWVFVLLACVLVWVALTEVNPGRLRWLGRLVCCVVILFMGYRRQERLSDAELEKNRFVLTPGDLPTPPTQCPTQDEETFWIFYGRNALGTKSSAIPIYVGSHQPITIERERNGAVFINCDLYDLDRHQIVFSSRSRFWVKPDANFERPNKSRLIVRESSGALLLDVQYLNRHAISFAGTLRLPTNPSEGVEVHEEYVNALGSSGRIWNNCAIGSNLIELRPRSYPRLPYPR